jgi:peroxiredoxin family protein
MKLHKVALAIAFSVLILAATAFSTGRKVAVFPTTASVNVNGPVTSVDLEAFCNQQPCNIQWILVLSNSAVGSIDNTTGPTTTFTAGTSSGTALVIANDGMGDMAHATITVVQ